MATLIRVSVIDSETEDPVKNAAFYLLNSNGDTTDLLGTSDDNGQFDIPAPSSNQKVQVDFPGYASQVIDPAYIAPFTRIKLVADPSGTLSGVVIKSIRKAKKSNYVLPIVMGSAAAVTFGIWLYRKYH